MPSLHVHFWNYLYRVVTHPRISAAPHVPVATLGLIVILATLIRAQFLNQPMHYDEAFTFTNYASRPLRSALADYSAPNNHVFHTLLVHLSYRLLGNHPWAIRLPAFCAGVLLVPAAYYFARVLYDKHTALLTAALTATSAPLVAYAANARGYSLISLTFLLLAGLGYQLKRGARSLLWLPCILLAALGFYTIPIMLYPFGSIVVWLSLSAAFGTSGARRTAFFVALGASLVCIAVLTAVFYQPILQRDGLEPLIANRFVAPQSWTDVIQTMPRLVAGLWTWWTAGIPGWMTGLLSASFLASIVTHRRLSDDRTLFGLALVAWSLAVIFITRTVPLGRVWLFSLPALLMIASAGVSMLLQPLIAKLARSDYAFALLSTLLVCGMSVQVLRTHTTVDRTFGDTAVLADGPDVAALLKAHLRPGDKILTEIPSDAPLEYYLVRNKVPASYLAWPSLRPTARPMIAGSTRLVVVVDEGSGQSFESVMEENMLDRTRYGPATVLQRFAHGCVVYVVANAP